ncbi:MAG: flavodoxin domain-containing protein [Candidatus Aminicenantes bacterium]|nr:flavodoxin domain-containing protein [Candidatus Aminicenantes bacterium]
MKTIIVYRSRHGCAEKSARLLEEQMKGDIVVFNLKDKPKIDIEGADAVIIGGSIHTGKIQGTVKKFCRDNLALLLQKKLGLYICCMEEGEKAQEEFETAYPEDLRSHAFVTGIFGGEFDIEKMNFVERLIIKKVAKVTSSVSKFKKEAVSKFAQDFNA